MEINTVELNTTYVDKHGYQILPLSQVDKYGWYICQNGYNIDLLNDNHLTRASVDISDIANGNYGGILSIHQQDVILNSNIIDESDFVPFMSLTELSNTNLNVELGKYYYDSKSNKCIHLIHKYSDRFYYYNSTNMPFDIITLNMCEDGYGFSPLWFNFITDFNDISHWVEIPEEFWKISSCEYGDDSVVIQQRLNVIKRKGIINKLLV